MYIDTCVHMYVISYITCIHGFNPKWCDEQTPCVPSTLSAAERLNEDEPAQSVGFIPWVFCSRHEETRTLPSMHIHVCMFV